MSEYSEYAVATGEVESFTPDRIVIAGTFSAGLALQLREGLLIHLLDDEAISQSIAAGRQSDRFMRDLEEEVANLEESLEREESEHEETQEKLEAAEAEIARLKCKGAD